MRRLAAALLSALAAQALLGCSGSIQPTLPAGCVADPGAITQALARAPEPVILPDGTPLSHCARAAGDADLQNLGVVLVAVAVDLAGRVPRSEHAAIELGYLVGTMRRGGAGDNGVHAELVRRLEQAVPAGAIQQRLLAYQRGLSAGAAAR